MGVPLGALKSTPSCFFEERIPYLDDTLNFLRGQASLIDDLAGGGEYLLAALFLRLGLERLVDELFAGIRSRVPILISRTSRMRFTFLTEETVTPYLRAIRYRVSPLLTT